VSGETRIPIRSSADIVEARRLGRELASEAGFAGSDLTVIATAISEIARNIIEYAGSGEIVLDVPPPRHGRIGLRVVARDQGPGIPNVRQVMQDGFSSGKGLGLGLPGARRLMDEFEVETDLGRGTVVTMTKWLSA
jgi:serine/threonine-protein kinase RsbT